MPVGCPVKGDDSEVTLQIRRLKLAYVLETVGFFYYEVSAERELLLGVRT